MAAIRPMGGDLRSHWAWRSRPVLIALLLLGLGVLVGLLAYLWLRGG